jgi:death-on-curing protein
LHYENTNTFECAAAYAFDISKAHAFIDGNKRTSFVKSVTFLRLTGLYFVTEPAEVVALMEDFATGAVSEERFKTGSSKAQLK